jgi:hypothetical protein
MRTRPTLGPRHGRSLGRTIASIIVPALIGVVVTMTPAAADVAAHPAHIHEGSCPEPGVVVGSLEDLVGERKPSALGSGDLITHPVRASLTAAVQIAYADLFATPHSNVVHQGSSEEDLAVYILCGDLSGHPLSEADIAIGLGELNASGFSGIATVHDNGDATVDVAVYLTTRDPWIGDVDAG